MPNRTTMVCPRPAISQVDKGNCTLITRDIDDRPAPGADPSTDFIILAPNALRHPSAWYGDGSGSEWYVEFETCEAGAHNITVMFGEANATATQVVVPSAVTNFTLDCVARSGQEVVAGSSVTCEAITVDGCENPSGEPSKDGTTWAVALVGAAINGEEPDALPVLQVDGDEPYAMSRGETVPTGSLYTAAFETGFYYRQELNYPERGTAGLALSLVSLNWTEMRASTVAVRAAPLSAPNTKAVCEPTTGLLQWHTATCYISTYDQYGNPQIGARRRDFVATYLENPGPLGESAGALARTDRKDTFSIQFQSFDPGETAGVTVAVTFPKPDSPEEEETYYAKATILVKSTELVLRPATAVVSVPLTFTVSLDAQGAAYDSAVLAFIPMGWGNSMTDGLEGGCQQAPTAPLRADVNTYEGNVELPFIFHEATDFGVCFYVNASTGDAYHGSLPEHYLAWRGRVRVLHPVQSLLDGATVAPASVNEPLDMRLDTPVVSGVRYSLVGDLLRFLPVKDPPEEEMDGNCTGAAANSTAGGIVQDQGGVFALSVAVRRPLRHKVRCLPSPAPPPPTP